MASPLKKKRRPMPPPNVRSLGSVPGRPTATRVPVHPLPFPPYRTPDDVRKEGPARQEARFNRVGGGAAGWRSPVPDTGGIIAPVHLPGGAVVTRALQHPTFTTVERLYRKLPEEGFYDDQLSPNRPFTFELGSFQAPGNMTLWVTDLEFGMLRLSGADPGDFVYAEDGRFSGQLMFDVQVGSARPQDLGYQLDPGPIVSESTYRHTDGRGAGPGRFPAAQAVFDERASQTFGATSGEGNSGLPVRSQPPGPRSGPFTLFVKPGQILSLRCTLFRPLQTPVAAFEGRFAGYQLATTLASSVTNRTAPR